MFFHFFSLQSINTMSAKNNNDYSRIYFTNNTFKIIRFCAHFNNS